MLMPIEGVRSFRGSAVCPHFAHTCARQPVVEAHGDEVEVVVEQVCVDVERHRRGRMPEHPLDRLHVRAGLDRDARGCMTQVVRSHARDAASPNRLAEPAAARLVCAGPSEVAAILSREDDLLRQLASASLRGRRPEQHRERDRTALVCVRRPNLDVFSDLDGVDRHVNSWAAKIDVLNSEADRFSKRRRPGAATSPTLEVPR